MKNEENNRRKRTLCFDFILCSHNKVQVRKAPHLTCHVLCTSLWPNRLSLPSVLTPISIKASFTPDRKTVFAFFFVVEVSSRLIFILRRGHVCFCVLVIAEKTWWGCCNVFFLLLLLIILNILWSKREMLLEWAKTCLHFHTKMYSVASVASLRCKFPIKPNWVFI